MSSVIGRNDPSFVNQIGRFEFRLLLVKLVVLLEVRFFVQGTKTQAFYKMLKHSFELKLLNLMILQRLNCELLKLKWQP